MDEWLLFPPVVLILAAVSTWLTATIAYWVIERWTSAREPAFGGFLFALAFQASRLLQVPNMESDARGAIMLMAAAGAGAGLVIFWRHKVRAEQMTVVES